MAWGDVDFDQSIVLGAPFGGPVGQPHARLTHACLKRSLSSADLDACCSSLYAIFADLRRPIVSAVLPDESKPIPVPKDGAAGIAKPCMRIFTSSGQRLSSFTVRHDRSMHDCTHACVFWICCLSATSQSANTLSSDRPPLSDWALFSCLCVVLSLC